MPMDENKSQPESDADTNANANADANANSNAGADLNASADANANTNIKKLRKVEIARIDLNRAVYWSIPPAVMLGICAFAWKLISAAPAGNAALSGLVLMLLTIAAVILAVGVTVRLFNRLADTKKLNLIISIRDTDESAPPETTEYDEAESTDEEADEEEPTDESSQETQEQPPAQPHWTEQPFPDPDEELFPKEEEEEEDSEKPEEKN